MKLICDICIPPVNGAVSIGKKLEGESDEDGKGSKCLFVFFSVVSLFGAGFYSPYDQLRRTLMERVLYHTAVQQSLSPFVSFCVLPNAVCPNF